MRSRETTTNQHALEAVSHMADGARSSRTQHPNHHPAPAGCGEDNAFHEQAPKRLQDSPESGRGGAPREAGLGAFLSDARGSGRCGSGDWRGSTTPLLAPAGKGGKKAPSRAFAAHPGKKVRVSVRPARKFPRSPALAGFAKQMGMVTMTFAQHEVRRILFPVLSCVLFVTKQNTHRRGNRTTTDEQQNGGQHD